MKRIALLFFTVLITLSVLISIVVLPPVFASNTPCSQRPKCTQQKNQKPKANKATNSVITTRLNNLGIASDQKVTVVNNGGGAGNKKTKTVINNVGIRSDQNITVINRNNPKKPQPKKPQPKKPAPRPVVNHVVNTTEQVTKNITINKPVVKNEIVHVDREIIREVEKEPREEIVYVEVPVKGDYTVYPVQNVTTTPETGAETLTLLGLPTMAGAGLVLRKKFLI